MLRNLPSKTLPADQQLAAVRAHFGEHGTALCNAAELIDGDTGTALVLRLMSCLREASRLDRQRAANWSIFTGFCPSTPLATISNVTFRLGFSSIPQVLKSKTSACSPICSMTSWSRLENWTTSGMLWRLPCGRRTRPEW